MKSLVIVHRGPEYQANFAEIAARVTARDPGIRPFILAAADPRPPPAWVWENPALTVALTSRFRLRPQRGPVLRNHQVDKLVQAKVFQANGIPTPPVLPFTFGMRLDPILFGDFVILKPMSLHLTSSGQGIHLLRRTRVERLTRDDFPAVHPIHRDRRGYLVQRFVDTGPHVSDNRVATFFGRVLYANCATARPSRPDLGHFDPAVGETAISSLVQDSDWRWHADADVLHLAERVHAAFPGIPLLGTDILREAGTGRLFVLECNPGGNTWHFSSPGGQAWRIKLGRRLGATGSGAEAAGRKMLLEQFGAFDIVAEALVAKTRALAA